MMRCSALAIAIFAAAAPVAAAQPPGVFRARFINETGTDIILVLESPEPGVGLTINLDNGQRSNVLNLRGGHRPLMAWDDTTLELVTLMPLVVDRNMRVHVRRTAFAAAAPAAPGGEGGPVEAAPAGAAVEATDDP